VPLKVLDLNTVGKEAREVGKKVDRNRWILSKTVLGFVKGFVRVKRGEVSSIGKH
jgi:hypothetical protein